MAEIVNLRTARKAKDLAAVKVKANANAAQHGRSKALKALEKAQAAKARRDLDGLRRDSVD